MSAHVPPTQASAIRYQEFYNDAVNNEDFNIKEDFRRWIQVRVLEVCAANMQLLTDAGAFGPRVCVCCAVVGR